MNNHSIPLSFISGITIHFLNGISIPQTKRGLKVDASNNVYEANVSMPF
jgi:hypothetical protein